ncbi:unnamed protein product [Mycena citricolor]|uniref:Uncharacterized protein n=1 Tax=Mycena citricolor TaxID=2018698 RepID=A0AAD2K0D7_9AGAR|nr:unnamed protein product [Mycena citricolor]
MSPEEWATLHGIGVDWVQGFVAITNETVWITVYAMTVLQACIVLLHKSRRHARTSQFYVFGILTLFASAVVLYALDLANFIVEAKMTLVDHGDADIRVRYDGAVGFILKLAAAQDALFAYMTILGDAIIIHRVWKLKAHRYFWVFVLLCALWTGAAVGTFMLTYCVATVGSGIVLGTFENPAFCRNAQTVTYVLPCATTAVATGLIAYTAWRYARETQLLTSSRRTNSIRNPILEILLLLIESGLLYLFFFIVLVVEVSPRGHAWIDSNPVLSLAFKMYTYCSSVIVGMYPTSLVVLSHSKYAVLDSPTASSVLSTLYIGGMHGPPTTGTASLLSMAAAAGSPPFKYTPRAAVDELELQLRHPAFHAKPAGDARQRSVDLTTVIRTAEV